MSLPHATIERVVKEAGIPRVSSAATKLLSAATEEYLKKMALRAYTYTQNSGRNTLKDKDVAVVLESL